ncbi:MAG: ABC transporter substrate-binding protein [Pseudomonadota bacterium]
MNLRRSLLALFLVVPLVGLTLLTPQRASSAATAGDFLVTMSETAINQLGDKDTSQAQKEDQFRELVSEAFDIPRISKFILGVNWRSASEEQRKAFIAAFEESNMRRFLPFFEDYKGEKFVVLSERQDSNNDKVFFVSSKIDRPGSEPIEVEWRVYKKDGKYKILDAVVEGVSMALSLRQEYNSVIQQSGLDGLISQLEKSAGQPVQQ